jgi:hypothetical protein
MMETLPSQRWLFSVAHVEPCVAHFGPSVVDTHRKPNAAQSRLPSLPCLHSRIRVAEGEQEGGASFSHDPSAQ